MRISDWSSDVCSSDLADIVEKAEALDDFLEDGLGDLILLIGKMPGQAFKKGERVHHAAAGGDGNVLASDIHGQRLGLQARAVAGLAGVRGLVLAKLLPHPGAVGLQHAAVEIAVAAFPTPFAFL